MNNLLRVVTCTGDDLHINVNKIYALGTYRSTTMAGPDGGAVWLCRVYIGPNFAEDYVDTNMPYEELVCSYRSTGLFTREEARAANTRHYMRMGRKDASQ